MIQRRKQYGQIYEIMGDNAEKRGQPVPPDQDIRDQQRSVEQTAEKFIDFNSYRRNLVQDPGLPR